MLRVRTRGGGQMWSQTGQVLKRLTGHSNWVEGVDVNANGDMILSASWDKTLKTYAGLHACVFVVVRFKPCAYVVVGALNVYQRMSQNVKSFGEQYILISYFRTFHTQSEL